MTGFINRIPYTLPYDDQQKQLPVFLYGLLSFTKITIYFRGVKFGIVIRFERRDVRLLVERVAQTPISEQFRVTARNHSFVLESNRPLLRGKGLKHKPINWKVVEGGFDKKYILELIIKEIEKTIAKLETKPG